ncbi:MAG TPA: histidine kinase [Microlunatus sp.]|nr:histidine kinase [Microlunatus sp.]
MINSSKKAASRRSAGASVSEERRRLSQDITDCLRQTLLAVEAEAATALIASDPVPGIQRIRRHTQLATTELRRQLGLLRAAESGAADVTSPPPRGRDTWIVQRADLTLAVLAVLLRVAGSARAHADDREAELQLAAATAVSAERRTFARELHDVVSHGVGLIAVQSGAVEVAWPGDPSATRESLRVIAGTASGALAELSRLSPDRSATTRTVRDLHALVERIRSAGTLVELNADLDEEAVLSPEVFRTVQEALTNVVRHAPSASARVAITGTSEETLVLVVDDGTTDEPSPQRGYGLVGLAERVSLAGGVLETGPDQDGRGFRVAASLPHGIGG